LFVLQAASSVKECEQLEERFKPGTPVQVGLGLGI